MKTTIKQPNIFTEPEKQVTRISKRSHIIHEGDVSILYIDYNPVFHFSFTDKTDNRIAAVILLNSKAAGIGETASVFGLHRNTIRNFYIRYEDVGFDWIHKSKGGPEGPTKITEAIRRRSGI